MSSEAKIKCPVLEMGKNSVIPSTIPIIAALSSSKRSIKKPVIMLCPVPGFFSKRYHVNRLEVQVQHSPSVVAVHSCAQSWQYLAQLHLNLCIVFVMGQLRLRLNQLK